jgi:hypothetical protein
MVRLASVAFWSSVFIAKQARVLFEMPDFSEQLLVF